MAREGLRSELEVSIRRAITQKKTITMKGLMVKTNGNHQTIDLTVKPFSESEGVKGLLMVVFGDIGAPSKRAASGKAKTGSASRQSTMYKELEKELAFTRERLQTTVEEMETSREELKSSNLVPYAYYALPNAG